MTDGMKPIAPRWREHLGTTDAAIIQMRRCILGAAKNLAETGATPPGLDTPEVFAVNSGTAVLPRSADWFGATAELMKAKVGKPVMSAY